MGLKNATPPPPCSMTRSVRSSWGIPKRRSGLSLPYLPIDSSNGICGKRPVGKRVVEIDPEDLLPDAEDQPLHRLEDVVLVDEAHLDVDLRELGLAIETQRLVPEALDDLEVLFEARHHVELLVELGALGERIELPRVQPRGHQEVAGAARGVPHHDGRLELEEAALVEVAPHDLVDAVADAQGLLERERGADRGSDTADASPRRCRSTRRSRRGACRIC